MKIYLVDTLLGDRFANSSIGTQQMATEGTETNGAIIFINTTTNRFRFGA